jgi:hypothetical protein
MKADAKRTRTESSMGQWDLNIAGKGGQLLQYAQTIHKGVTPFIRIEEMHIPGHYVRLHL